MFLNVHEKNLFFMWIVEKHRKATQLLLNLVIRMLCCDNLVIYPINQIAKINYCRSFLLCMIPCWIPYKGEITSQKSYIQVSQYGLLSVLTRYTVLHPTELNLAREEAYNLAITALHAWTVILSYAIGDAAFRWGQGYGLLKAHCHICACALYMYMYVCADVWYGVVW